MFLFIVTAIALWFLGAAMQVAKPARWAMIGVLYFGILLALLVLPEDNGLRQMLGASFGQWALLGGAGVIGWLYAMAVGRLRAKAKAPAPEPKGDGLGPSELDRYARHIMLREIGGVGQNKLRNAKVLVVGAGGLGSPALQYLGAAGVGTIGVIDDDVVENSNLQRQVIHTDQRIDMPKVFSAQEAIKAQNPHVTVLPFMQKLTAENAEKLIGQFDLVLDGTDDTNTRYLVNSVCTALKKPLISGALSQWEGQVSLFDPASRTPCYACVFPSAPADGLAPSCAEAGVLAALPGVVGSMMAAEAVKAITGAGEGLHGRMLIYDALYGEIRTIALKRAPDCPVCGGETGAQKVKG